MFKFLHYTINKNFWSRAATGILSGIFCSPLIFFFLFPLPQTKKEQQRIKWREKQQIQKESTTSGPKVRIILYWKANLDQRIAEPVQITRVLFLECLLFPPNPKKNWELIFQSLVGGAFRRRRRRSHQVCQD